MNTRRNLLRTLGVSAAGLAAQRVAQAATYIPVVPSTGVTGRVVVVGGGMGGASVAKYLRLWGGTKLEVVVVEPDTAYLSNIMSNFVLTGTRTLSSLGYTLSNLVKRYGVKVVQGRVTAINPSASGGTVSVGTTTIAYDRLVLAPGLDFAAVPGVATDRQQYFPHAWKTGPQTTELRRQLLAMPSTSGQFLMSIPAAPYRCPPGPYERACLIADWLQRNKPGSKVYVLDENADVVAENATFRRAFSQLYPNTIVYLPSTTITSVQGGSTGGGTVYTASVTGIVAGTAQAGAAGQTFTNVNVISPITPQRAGSVLASVNGGSLLNALGGRFAAVNVLSYESTGIPRIHVIGDAAQTTQPKAGHIANQEGKVCADAIVRLMAGLPLDPAPMTNSACYSPVNATQASWLSMVYGYDGTSGTMVKTAGGEAETWTSKNFEQMGKWFRQLMADTYA